MIKIHSNIIPFNGFIAMTIWPFVFIRNDKRHLYNSTADRHERIHAEQQKEVLIIAITMALSAVLTGSGWWSLLWLPLYYYLYLMEWVICLVACKPYYNISFEREAYRYETDASYLQHRPLFAWISLIRNS